MTKVDEIIKMRQNGWTSMLLQLFGFFSKFGRLIISTYVLSVFPSDDLPVLAQFVLFLTVLTYGVWPFFTTMIGALKFEEGLWPKKKGVA